LLGFRLARHGQDAAAGPQASVQAQFSGAAEPFQFLGIKLTAGDEQGQRDRQIEGRSLLASIGWSQIDDDPNQGPAEPAVAQRCPDAFARLLDGRIWKSYKLQAGKPWGQIHFHRDG
jgi:hypothetical protein